VTACDKDASVLINSINVRQLVHVTLHCKSQLISSRLQRGYAHIICGTRTRTAYPVNIPGRTRLGKSSHRDLHGNDYLRQALDVQAAAPGGLPIHKGQHYLLMPEPFVGTFVVHHCIFDHAWQTFSTLGPCRRQPQTRDVSLQKCLRITGVNMKAGCAFLQAFKVQVKKRAVRSKHSME
jgi:hypothetical protein